MENETTPSPRDIATQLIISGIIASMPKEQRAQVLSMTEVLLNTFVNPMQNDSEAIKNFAHQVEAETYKMIRGLNVRDESESH
ncbi:hypothetical protein FDX24_13480 [Citrobacter sp. wls716]|uniref:hypothetical protein n=1 Tax=Citrobacter sp. wls716 TaxID=2576420 RepID=UPI001137F9D6|nr:hypothetical protein [Citrobacter sp. wls716]TKU39770.1 hypothetical protein FDX24_13480 [Citrobacter sp. wls716]